jgi:spore coat polysaccharide biosynthesis protein SpsF (cytidylyltransferase family)
MRTAVIVQARTNSDRLKGKILKDVDGLPLIFRVVERARAIPGVDAVAVTVPESDYELVRHHLADLAVVVHPAPKDVAEWDVLQRYAISAARVGAEAIVRITADCPFVPTDLAASVIAPVTQLGAQYSATRTNQGGAWPDGFDIEAFTYEALRRANLETPQAQREDVTPWIRNVLVGGAYVPLSCSVGWPAVKLSVDTEADLFFARAVQRVIRPKDFSWLAVYKAVEAVQAQL